MFFSSVHLQILCFSNQKGMLWEGTERAAVRRDSRSFYANGANENNYELR
jgi:hypothetical protein